MEGPTMNWNHEDGTVTVTYPKGFNPYSEERRKLIYAKNGEIMPIFEYERRDWDMKLDYWHRHGENPPMHIL